MTNLSQDIQCLLLGDYMAIEDVNKKLLIAGLTEIGRADRTACFKKYSIKFASAKAFWFGVCNAFAKRTVDLIGKQLNERNLSQDKIYSNRSEKLYLFQKEVEITRVFNVLKKLSV